MRILAISYCFPPVVSAETFVAASTLGGLAERGCDVTVVATSHSRIYKNSPQLLRISGERVKRIGVRPRELPRLVHRALHKIAPALLYMPDPFRLWAKPAAKVAEQVAARERFDVIYSRAQPFTSHVAVLQTNLPEKLPWVAHFSDPMTDNPFGRFRSASRVARFNRDLEGRIFARARELHFTSRETIELVGRGMAPEIRAKMYESGHSYMAELYPERKSSAEIGGPTVIAHIGSFTGERNPAAFLAAVASLRQRKPDLLQAVRIKFVGFCSGRIREMIAAQRLEDVIEITGEVDYFESLAQMKESDILLLIDADFPGHNVFFPSKLALYLGSGREVMAITPADGPSRRILGELGHSASAAPGDVAAIRALLEQKLRRHPGAPPPPSLANPAVVERLYQRLWQATALT